MNTPTKEEQLEFDYGKEEKRERTLYELHDVEFKDWTIAQYRREILDLRKELNAVLRYL